MTSGSIRFDRFVLDDGDRLLMADGVRVELNARYFDALALLVREQGKLVSKDRFLTEVWRGVPVTDEALTQCIRTLRRQLGDSATSPRFIETVPKHGYRFIVPVERVEAEGRAHGSAAAGGARVRWRRLLLLGGAGTAGGGVAGLIGGLFYGLAGASQPLAGMGAMSVLLVLLCVVTMVALVGGAGVGFGIAAAGFAGARPWRWSMPGGAAGGLIVGAAVKLLGLDAFTLLLGRSPVGITGATEGLLLGAGVGAGAWAGSRWGVFAPSRRRAAVAALSGGGAGVIITAMGGRLMGGSLDLLARAFPASHLRLDPIGAAFAEKGFGPVSQIVTGGLEGALFGGCIVGAMALAARGLQTE